MRQLNASLEFNLWWQIGNSLITHNLFSITVLLSTAQATLILFNFSISLFLNCKDIEDFRFITVMIYTDFFFSISDQWILFSFSTFLNLSFFLLSAFMEFDSFIWFEKTMDSGLMDKDPILFIYFFIKMSILKQKSWNLLMSFLREFISYNNNNYNPF